MELVPKCKEGFPSLTSKYLFFVVLGPQSSSRWSLKAEPLKPLNPWPCDVNLQQYCANLWVLPNTPKPLTPKPEPHLYYAPRFPSLLALRTWTPLCCSRVWDLGCTLPQTNMETHLVPFLKDCSLYKALFGFPC